MGGARINAGRKLNPEPRLRLLIGAECERLATERAEAGALAHYQAIMRPTEIESTQAAVRRMRDGDATEDDTYEAEVATENIDEHMRGVKMKHPKLGSGFLRATSIPVHHPKGRQGESIRAQIISQVATTYDATTPVVDKCWKEYRRFLNGDATPWRRRPKSAATAV
jgi:hypothetical protein